MLTLVCGMICRRFFDYALCCSSMTQTSLSKLTIRPVSPQPPATTGPRLTILPARSMYAWLSECRVVVPQLTDLNDLLVKRATDAAALPGREAYLTFRCCSIFVLASLAQLYDTIARSPITPSNESTRFRGICDDTLKDVAKITLEFTKDDYSFLDPALSVSPPTTRDHDGTESSLGELGTCIESRCGGRRPRVISHVCGRSLIDFTEPRKSTFTHPDVPRREEQP